MVIIRKSPIILIYFFFVTGGWPPLLAHVQRHGWNGVIVKEVSPGVSVVLYGTAAPIYKWGMSLYEKDEVQTNESGRAIIRFSPKEIGNEIILGSSTGVRISRISSKFDYSVYRVTVLRGKIWVKDLPSQSRKVLVNAGKCKIMPFGGEYVVEQFEKQTLAASSSGNVRVLDKSTNQYTPLPPDEIAAVSAKTGELNLMWIPKRLVESFQSISATSDMSGDEIRKMINERHEQVEAILAREATEKETND